MRARAYLLSGMIFLRAMMKGPGFRPRKVTSVRSAPRPVVPPSGGHPGEHKNQFLETVWPAPASEVANSNSCTKKPVPQFLRGSPCSRHGSGKTVLRPPPGRRTRQKNLRETDCVFLCGNDGDAWRMTRWARQLQGQVLSLRVQGLRGARSSPATFE